MHLKRLELLGFKSFASRTVLELDRGVTALVGPNGCGKSNVVDAVRWALGEQSLRAVRSRKSEEVIFAGNGKRPPTGMAEVTLVLDNSDGHFPLPFTEVSVTRRQYRSGEGEYLINRGKARLRDILELLSHASLGPDSYAVVNQGAVDEVLLQRPEERRALLESAADISRHQAKLKESLDKLAETEANILRAEDIRSEIGPRLAKLKTQANRARRYEEYVERLRTMVLWRYLLQLRQLRGRFSADLEVEREKAEAATRASAAYEAARQHAATLRGQLRGVEAEAEAARESLASIRLARAAAEREAALREERERSHRRQIEEARGDLERAGKERADLQEELAALEARQREWAERERVLRAQLEPLEAERRRAQSEERLLRAQLDRALAEQRGAAARGVELRERCNTLRREASRIAAARAESQEAARHSAERLERLEAELAGLRDALAARRDELAALESRHRGLQDRLKETVVELEAARRRERQAWQRDNELMSRLGMLQSLKEQHRGLASGARAILEARLPGTRGTLASTMQVPAEYVVPISAALGGAQGYVVVDGPREGLEALRFAAKRGARATVTPIQIGRPGEADRGRADLEAKLAVAAEGIAFRGLASDLVECAPEAKDLCSRYLGLTLVVEGEEDAVELYRRLGELLGRHLPFQVVTMDGKLLRARGDMVVSPPGGDREGDLVARDAELAALSEQAAEASAALEGARDRVAALEAAHSRLSAETAAANAELPRGRAQIEKQNAAYAEQASQVAKVEASIEWHRTRVAGLDREASQNAEAQARAESELAAFEAKRGQSVGVVEQLQADLADAQSAVAASAGRCSRLQADLAAVQNGAREAAARASALSEALRRSDERVRRQEERVEQLSRSLEELHTAAQPAAQAVSQRGMEAAEKHVAAASAKVAEARQRCDTADAEAAALARARDAAGEELGAARARSQRTGLEMGLLMREAAREASLEMAEAEPESSEELLGLSELVEEALSASLASIQVEKLPQTFAEVSAKTDSIRKELQAIGAINAEAPEEYRQLSERFSFLADQLEDLRAAERTLRKAIDELRTLMETRFQETFNLVNEEFGRCFSNLFGGGSARLVLTDPEQPLSGGVDVVASLPGKRSASLLGFSGGERALTAVALLFAMMRVNPSPFCLLDEVDAALDESNVRRFCEMLKGLSCNTQFLLITHNRTTMEMAGTLYGVSMLSDSTSRVMSLRLNGHS